jgi:uncharacterized protein YukE
VLIKQSAKVEEIKKDTVFEYKQRMH